MSNIDPTRTNAPSRQPHNEQQPSTPTGVTPSGATVQVHPPSANPHDQLVEPSAFNQTANDFERALDAQQDAPLSERSASRSPAPSPAPAPGGSTSASEEEYAEYSDPEEYHQACCEYAWNELQERMPEKCNNLSILRNFNAEALTISYTPSQYDTISNANTGLVGLLEQNAERLISSLPHFSEVEANLTSIGSDLRGKVIEHVALDMPRYLNERADLKSAFAEGLKIIFHWHDVSRNACRQFLGEPDPIEPSMFDHDLCAAYKRDMRSWPPVESRTAAQTRDATLEDIKQELILENRPPSSEAFKGRVQNVLRTPFHSVHLPPPGIGDREFDKLLGKYVLAFACGFPKAIDERQRLHRRIPGHTNEGSLAINGTYDENRVDSQICTAKKQLMRNTVDRGIDALFLREQRAKFGGCLEVMLDFIEQQPESAPPELRKGAFEKAAQLVTTDMTWDDVMDVMTHAWDSVSEEIGASAPEVWIQTGPGSTAFVPRRRGEN